VVIFSLQIALRFSVIGEGFLSGFLGQPMVVKDFILFKGQLVGYRLADLSGICQNVPLVELVSNSYKLPALPSLPRY
jgi:hypothetical protein